MNKILVVLALLLPLACSAQRKGFKVVETVPSSEPKWVSAKENPDFIYVMGQEGATLADAKTAAMQVVFSDIAQSVAVNVAGDITDMSVLTVDNENVNMEQTVVNNVKTKIAKLPAIQGITVQKADVYYKRFYNKKSREEYYVLYLRYPFNELERRDLIKAYNDMEKAVDDKISAYKEGIISVESIEDINNAISDLVSLKKSLDPDDARIPQITYVINLYEYVNASVMIDVIENTKGRMVVRLVYDGRTITTNQKPKVTSSCAQDFYMKPLDGKWVITFDSEYCYEDDEPTVDIVFKTGQKSPSKHVKIKFNK